MCLLLCCFLWSNLFNENISWQMALDVHYNRTWQDRARKRRYCHSEASTSCSPVCHSKSWCQCSLLKHSLLPWHKRSLNRKMLRLTLTWHITIKATLRKSHTCSVVNTQTLHAQLSYTQNCSIRQAYINVVASRRGSSRKAIMWYDQTIALPQTHHLA